MEGARRLPAGKWHPIYAFLRLNHALQREGSDLMQRAHAIESRLTQVERFAVLRPSLTMYLLTCPFQT
jgi:hypothetical protein